VHDLEEEETPDRREGGDVAEAEAAEDKDSAQVGQAPPHE